MRTKIMKAARTDPWLLLILAAFLALGVTYSIVTPIFEAGDELWHYPFVQSLATGHSLPVQDPNAKTLWEQEGGQPPLYYVVSALATFWIDTRDLPDRLWRNPEAKIGIPLAFGNKNMIVHTSAENIPWQGTTLAIHLIRFLSIVFSSITVALTYLLALEIKESRGLASTAAAFVAFNPMFIFISASVNNDNLATMLATLALWQLTRFFSRGATARRFIALGVVLGLGALTKVSNLGLLVVTACVFAYLLWREWKKSGHATVPNNHPVVSTGIGLRGIILGSLLCAALVVVIAFWWYVRNWILYGDLLAFNVWVAIAGGRPIPVTPAGLLAEFQGFRISYWGNLGGVNLIAPEWVYVVLDTFTGLAVVGLLIGLVRRALPQRLAISALWLVLIMVSLVRWTMLTMASQGRLIFPAIGAVAILTAYGLEPFSVCMSARARTLRAASVTLAGFLLVFAAVAPFALVAPAYALPMRYPIETAVPHPVHLLFDRQAELVGYDLPVKSLNPGAELALTLYWRARERLDEDLSVYVRLFDSADRLVGRWEAFPGGGLYPTRLWQPGEVIEDKYRLPVAPDARNPGVGRIEVGLFRRAPLETLTARDPNGQTVTPIIGRFKIAGQSKVVVQNPMLYDLDDKIDLVGSVVQPTATAGSIVPVRLFWRARAPLTEDYKVFVHLVDADDHLVSQKDDQPQQGAYPTSFWDVGETVADEYALAIPNDLLPGEYEIRVGIYRAADDVRLLVRGSDHIQLTTLRVTR